MLHALGLTLRIALMTLPQACPQPKAEKRLLEKQLHPLNSQRAEALHQLDLERQRADAAQQKAEQLEQEVAKLRANLEGRPSENAE